MFLPVAEVQTLPEEPIMPDKPTPHQENCGTSCNQEWKNVKTEPMVNIHGHYVNMWCYYGRQVSMSSRLCCCSTVKKMRWL